MNRPIGNGTLFESDAKRRFDVLTRERYKSLSGRMARKGYPSMPFTLEKFRDHCLMALRGAYDGAICCRYCRNILDFSEVVGDHAVPLSRGGSPGIANIEFICAPCNDQKGSCLPGEWEECLIFFARVVPMARPDILARLQKATKLAASMRHSMGRITELKKTGAWQKAGKRKHKPAQSRAAQPDDF